ncbi:MAG: hypothetical protein NW204_10650 [Xanthomonadaceae bacterium]|nr:hypothetical protein [Xanthomonadaceae bacterium]
MAELQRLHQGRADRPAVIFIHGLGGHPIDTWRHADCAADDCWPHWIGRDSGCDTWVLGYDAALSAWREQAMPLPDQGDQVADLLATHPELAARSLVLIGHSMGGLVIKTLIADTPSKGDQRFNQLVNRICGVVFIASPHSGSQLAGLARAAKFVLRTNAQVGNMQLHDPHLRQLNQRFRAAVSTRGLQARIFAERHGVPVGFRIFGWHIGPRIMVVDPDSADPALPEAPPVPLAEDHFSICKPVDRDKQIHGSLCEFLSTLSQPPPVGAVMPSPPSSPPAVPPRETARLSGSADNRLQPREGRLYGRDAEVDQVLSFLRGQQSLAVVSAQVAGVGGIGKTEVCKAALKAWLGERPEAVAYYVNIPDRATPSALIDAIGRALGADAVDSWQQLRPVLHPGLYYLDNLESVAEQADGQHLLRDLAAVPGMRLLASSRVSLPALLGKPILIEALPDADALQLFRDLWGGVDRLPPDAELQGFVVRQLGGHPLSIALCARLGDCYGYAELLRRWFALGTTSLSDVHDASRLGSVAVSMRLTADALAAHPGALALWTAAAIFADGVPDALLSQLERAGGWSEARPWLVRHHLLTRRDDVWHMLPPVSRHALDAAARVKDGFDWRLARTPLHALFGAMARDADSVASTTSALAARRLLLDRFGDLARLLQQELACSEPDKAWLQATHEALRNHYQFRVALGRDILQALAPVLHRPASAWRSLGDLESRLGRPDEARALYERALDLYAIEQEPMGSAYTWAELARCWHALAREAERDAALVQAFGFAKRAGAEPVREYVLAVLVEVTGGEDAAAQWMAGHVPDD